MGLNGRGRRKGTRKGKKKERTQKLPFALFLLLYYMERRGGKERNALAPRER